MIDVDWGVYVEMVEVEVMRRRRRRMMMMAKMMMGGGGEWCSVVVWRWWRWWRWSVVVTLVECVVQVVAR